MVLAADVHVGKEATFRRHGVPLPEGGTTERLDRLTQCVETLDAERLVVLGDFIHAPVGLTRSVVDAVASWSDQLSAEILVIEGNHDRKLRRFPDAWDVRPKRGPVDVEPFSLQHDPAVDGRGYILAGHLHPTVDLRQGGDRLRLPCYRFDEGVGVLPAFTPFSNGIRQEHRAGRRLFALTDDEVIALNAEQ
jgi:DNA ligase-associated metallophosphoesterase